MQIFSLDLFTYDSFKKIYTVEASTLQEKLADRFAIRSKSTGNTAFFKFDKVVRDREGEITHTEYTPAENEGSMRAVVLGAKVMIFND